MKNWSEHELETREALVKYFTKHVTARLRKINPAFAFFRTETSVMSGGCHEFARQILSQTKQKLPIVVWQHARSSRDYRLEYLLYFSSTTRMSYLPVLVQACREMLKKQCGAAELKDNCFLSDNQQVLVELSEFALLIANVIGLKISLDVCVDAFIRQESSV